MKAAALALVGVFAVAMGGILVVYALAQWARLAAPEPPPCSVVAPEAVVISDRGQFLSVDDAKRRGFLANDWQPPVDMPEALTTGLVAGAYGGPAAAAVGAAAGQLDHDVPGHEPTVSPLLAGALNTGGQWRVLCASMDGGAPTDLMVPTDGGTAGIRVPAEAIYVAPTEGSSVNVHVGFNTTSAGRPSGAISASTGFIVGTTGRDGVGVSLDAKSGSNPACLSSGAAQAVDVIAGRQ